MLGHEDYTFLLRVIDAIVGNLTEAKFRQIRADVPQVIRVREELETIGFVLMNGRYCLEEGFDTELMREHRKRIQDLADMTLDPNSMSLAQVAEVLQRNGRLPGIIDTINDDPIGGPFDLGEGVARPNKPWEN